MIEANAIAAQLDSIQVWLDHVKRHQRDALPLELDSFEELRHLSAASGAIWQALCMAREVVKDLEEMHRHTPNSVVFKLNDGALLAMRDRARQGGSEAAELETIYRELDSRGIDRDALPMVWQAGTEDPEDPSTWGRWVEQDTHTTNQED